jgi:uncharacterized protein Veg
MNIKNLIQGVKNTASVVALVVFRFPSVFILKHDNDKYNKTTPSIQN